MATGPTDWMLYANPAIYAGRGSVHGDGRVYSIHGRLLSSYSVLAMVRPFAAPPESLGGRHARRFVSEALSYNALGFALHNFDPLPTSSRTCRTG